MKVGSVERTGILDRSGQSLGEYALIIALLSIGLIVLLLLFRDAIGAVFSVLGASLTNN